MSKAFTKKVHMKGRISVRYDQWSEIAYVNKPAVAKKRSQNIAFVWVDAFLEALILRNCLCKNKMKHQL
jgi:hypothetical protein